MSPPTLDLKKRHILPAYYAASRKHRVRLGFTYLSLTKDSLSTEAMLLHYDKRLDLLFCACDLGSRLVHLVRVGGLGRRPRLVGFATAAR